jgi:hypothetical protein
MKSMHTLFLFAFMKGRSSSTAARFLRPAFVLLVLFPMLLARCTKEELSPDNLYAEPLSVALRFVDDAGLMQAGILRADNFMAAFNDINASSQQLLLSDTIFRNGIPYSRKNYAWMDTVPNYRRGSINYPGTFSIIELSPNRHELQFDVRFYRNDSLQVFYLRGNVILSSTSAGFSTVSGSFSIKDPQSRNFELKIDLKRQQESGIQTLTFNDDRCLNECTGIIASQQRNLRFATLTPLVRVSATNCDFQAGETGLSADGWPAQILSYGNGGCDRIYYLSENSNQKQFTLP